MLCSPERGFRALDRIAVGRREDGTEAEAEREQIRHGDRAPGGNRVVEVRVDRAQHAAARELGHEVVDRVVEAQRAVLHEGQRGHRGDGLRERRHTEDRVARERLVAGHRRRAEHLDVHVVALRDERDQPRHLPLGDVRGEEVVQPRQAGG